VAAPSPTPPPRRVLRTALRWSCSLAVLVAVGLVVRDRFGAVDRAVLPHPAALLATTALFAAANECLVRAWLALVALGGGDLDRRRGRWVWASSQLTRYAMGMAQVASRAVVARRHGLRASAGAVTTLLEVVWYTCLNALVAVATAPLWLRGTGLGWAAWLAVAPGAVLALALVAPQAFVRLTALLGRLPVLRRRAGAVAAAAVDVDRGDTWRLTLAYGANFLLRLSGFVVLHVAVGGDLGDLGRVTGAFALGHLVGAVALFAPGGLGPREGVTALVLAPVLGAGPVLSLVAVTRLLELAAELGYAGAARLAHVRAGGTGRGTAGRVPATAAAATVMRRDDRP
jgi:glycosyltransferase 2 family protein